LPPLVIPQKLNELSIDSLCLFCRPGPFWFSLVMGVGEGARVLVFPLPDGSFWRRRELSFSGRASGCDIHLLAFILRPPASVTSELTWPPRARGCVEVSLLFSVAANLPLAFQPLWPKISSPPSHPPPTPPPPLPAYLSYFLTMWFFAPSRNGRAGGGRHPLLAAKRGQPQAVSEAHPHQGLRADDGRQHGGTCLLP